MIMFEGEKELQDTRVITQTVELGGSKKSITYNTV